MITYHNIVLEESFFDLDKLKKKVTDFFAHVPDNADQEGEKIEKKLLSKKEKIASKIKENEEKLKREGIDPTVLAAIAKKHAHKAYKMIKENPSKFSFSKSCTNMLNEAVRKMTIQEALLTSVSLLILVCITSSFFNVLFSIIFGDELFADMLVGIFVAPFVEEAGKLISIKQGYAGMYFVVFNFTEFISYVALMLDMGVGLGTAVFWRLVGVVMHGIFTLIHLHYHKKKKDKNASAIGYFITVLLHGLWNTAASFGVFG